MIAGDRRGRRLWRDQGGQTTTEYLLFLAVIMVPLVLAGNLLVPYLRDGFKELARRIIENRP